MNLPDAPWKYFVRTATTVLIPVASLRASHVRPSTALQFMRAAYAGTAAKRKPLTVRALGDGTYEVLDGNSTLGVAQKAGWKELPAEIKQEEVSSLAAHAFMAALFEEWFSEETYPVGTVRKWRTGSVIKTRDGEWVPYRKGSAHVAIKAPEAHTDSEDPMAAIERLRAEGRLPAHISAEEHRAVAQEMLGQQQVQFPATLDHLHTLAEGDGAAVLGRVKEILSALGKMVRKPHKYKSPLDLMDGTGFRIICQNIADLRKTVEQVKANYETSEADEENYIDNPKEDDGYRSYHLIIKDTDGWFKELQIRTPNEDTWANWCHDIYKPRTPEQRALLKNHAEDLRKYSKAMSDYYYAKDTGAATRPTPPECLPIVEKVFGCLPL